MVREGLAKRCRSCAGWRMLASAAPRVNPPADPRSLGALRGAPCARARALRVRDAAEVRVRVGSRGRRCHRACRSLISASATCSGWIGCRRRVHGLCVVGALGRGRAGHGVAVGLGWAVGRARGLAPIALVGGGGALLLRPVWPALRPLRTGAICLSASITLALAAGTLGVSSGPGTRSASWTSAFLQAHAASRARRSTRARTGWCRTWAWTYSWSSCSWWA